MNWTTEPPTEPGFYWWRQGKRLEMAHIKDDGIGLVIAWTGERDICPRSMWQPHWEWWPERIPEPDEDKQK